MTPGHRKRRHRRQRRTRPRQRRARPAPTMSTGTTEKQAAQTIKTESPTEAELLREYAKQLSKKVRANLVNPGSGHASSATVSFFILSDGHIRPDSLKIVASSGQYKVDASALQTIRASVPSRLRPGDERQDRCRFQS